jgi:hypothetical protein
VTATAAHLVLESQLHCPPASSKVHMSFIVNAVREWCRHAAGLFLQAPCPRAAGVCTHVWQQSAAEVFGRFAAQPLQSSLKHVCAGSRCKLCECVHYSHFDINVQGVVCLVAGLLLFSSVLVAGLIRQQRRHLLWRQCLLFSMCSDIAREQGHSL